jgi:hypothetical protein
MAARHLRNKTLEVADSDVQDSATVIGEDTQSISRVTNSDTESHVSAQIQGMLADVLSTLSSIQSQKRKKKKKKMKN